MKTRHLSLLLISAALFIGGCDKLSLDMLPLDKLPSFGACPIGGEEIKEGKTGKGCIKKKGDKGIIRHGNWQYLDASGKTATAGAFTNGYRTGTWTWFYANGLKRLEGNYEEGRYVGVWQRFNEKGLKVWEGSFKNGRKDGLWTWWHDVSGVRKREGSFANDAPVGQWVAWDEAGQKTREVSYDSKPGAAASATN